MSTQKSAPSLGPTSYLVLGLVAQHEPVTPYHLKKVVAESIGYFWSFPHSQLYAEPARLAEEGLLVEEQEQTGRRRRTYTITESGRAALDAWLAEPTAEPTEVRDLGLLKLFFGALAEPQAVAALAERQRDAHAERLAVYEKVCAHVGAADSYRTSTVGLGLAFERGAVAFWDEILRHPPQPPRQS